MKSFRLSLAAQPDKDDPQCNQQRSDQSLPAVAFSKPDDSKQRGKNNAQIKYSRKRAVNTAFDSSKFRW